jgi:hypothetical protein
MKKLFLICCLFTFANQVKAQSDKEKIEKTSLNYLEGFYEGDTAKLIQSLKPSLYKFGYWRKKAGSPYEEDGQMTYRQAIDYAKRVWDQKKFAKADAPKKAEVLDIMNTIAAAKVTAWWGTDYLLLARKGDLWVIEEILWEGPLQK